MPINETAKAFAVVVVKILEGESEAALALTPYCAYSCTKSLLARRQLELQL